MGKIILLLLFSFSPLSLAGLLLLGIIKCNYAWITLLIILWLTTNLISYAITKGQSLRWYGATDKMLSYGSLIFGTFLLMISISEQLMDGQKKIYWCFREPQFFGRRSREEWEKILKDRERQEMLAEYNYWESEENY